MNDGTTESSASPTGEGSAKIIGLAEQVFHKHAPETDPQGQAAPMAGTPGAPLPPSPLNSDLIKRVAKSCLGAVDSTIQRRLYSSALAVSKDEGFAKNIALEVGLQDSEKQEISELISILCEKYSFASLYAPEIGLGFILLGYGFRVQFAIGKLNQIAKQNQPLPQAAK